MVSRNKHLEQNYAGEDIVGWSWKGKESKGKYLSGGTMGLWSQLDKLEKHIEKASMRDSGSRPSVRNEFSLNSHRGTGRPNARHCTFQCLLFHKPHVNKILVRLPWNLATFDYILASLSDLIASVIPFAHSWFPYDFPMTCHSLLPHSLGTCCTLCLGLSSIIGLQHLFFLTHLLQRVLFLCPNSN
jgi:hypothetical protein